MSTPAAAQILALLQQSLLPNAATIKSQQDTIKQQSDTIAVQATAMANLRGAIDTLTHDRDSAVTAAKANADDAQAARDLRDFIVANADKLGITLPT